MNLIQEYNEFYRVNPQKWTNDSHDEDILNIFEKSFENVLDIGCGNGHTISFFSKRWPDANFTGIDFSIEAINFCSKRGIEKAEFYPLDIFDFKSKKRFDLILLIGVAEHFLFLEKSLQKIYEIMDEKTVLFVEVPNCIAYQTSNGEEGYKRVEMGSRQMEWHLFRESWESLFLRTGFEIKKSLKGKQLWSEFQWILGKKK